MIQLSQICAVVNGALTGADVMFHNVSINSREPCDGRLFVALKGNRFDAHDYLQQAVNVGAVALLVEQEVSSTIPVIRVASTHQALKDLAKWWREQLVLPVIGITGSVGKTTVKEMVGAIFAQLGQGVVTEGNLNNEIGVPLTLMRLDKHDQYAVVEMGMNHAGEIDRLSQIAKPTVALITNAGEAHLENLGSVAGVAAAKGEIFNGLTPDGTAVINADDEFASYWLANIGSQRVMTFGLDRSADVRAQYQQSDGVLQIEVTSLAATFELTLKTIGRHNVQNALAATAVALAANLPVEVIQRGLADYRPPSGRLRVSQLHGRTVIDDTYNANPTSMAAAIDVLKEFDDATLILGDMAELGEHAEAAHRNLGRLAKQSGIGSLLACGQYADWVVSEFGSAGHAFDTQVELIKFLTLAPPSGAVLVKGSRSAAMENVVRALSEIMHQAIPTMTQKKKGDAGC